MSNTPSVTSITPINSSTNIAVDTNIVINFSQGSGYLPLNTATILSTTAYLQTSEGSSVACSLDPLTYKITLTPSSALLPLTRYKVSLIGGTNGIKDMSGTPMTGSRYFYFTTATSEVIEVPELTLPANESAVYEKPLLTWSDTSATTYNVEISENSDFSIIYTSVEVGTNAYQTSSLTYGIYYWRVKGIVTDGESDFSQSSIFEYRESADPAPITSVPIIIGSNPIDGALNVSSTNTPFVELIYNSEVDITKLSVTLTSKTNTTKKQ